MRIWLLMLGAAACVSSAEPAKSTFVRMIDTDGDEAVSVVNDVRFEGHEPRRIPPETLRRLFMASGIFVQSDADELSGAVSDELAAMEPAEYVRITAWADDGVRRTFVWISGGKLRMAYFRGDVELDRWDAPIPSGEVATFAAPDAAPPPDVPPYVAPVDGGVLATAPPPVEKVKRKARCPAIAARDATPISEGAAREKITKLDELLEKKLIDRGEHRCKRKEILARL